MITQDHKTSPFKRTAIVKAQAAKRKRNATIAAIAVNTVGGLIGALCVIYATTVIFN
jgi:hypothetical protein